MTIHDNVAKIRENIAIAANKSGQDSNGIKLVGVTKTIEVERIKELLLTGVNCIGESRVQEFLPKYEILQNSSSVKEWHFIGHLQRNKVKFIIDKVDLIHSVDSFALAQEINRQAKKINRNIAILAELNIANEASKFGLSPDKIFEFIYEIQSLSNISFTGLMCIAPFVENPEKNRVHFAKMKKLALDIQSQFQYHECNLSMGMTNDYIVAIEEGANIIRIGTALFMV